MVFCYKLVTDVSPRASSVRTRSPCHRLCPPVTGSALPASMTPSSCAGHVTPACRVPLVPASNSILAPHSEGFLDELMDIHPREWRLLAALARKREDELMRSRLREHCRALWTREKEQRKMLIDRASEEYQRYLSAKRAEEQAVSEALRSRRGAELARRRGLLQARLLDKERRARDVLAGEEEKKTLELLERATTSLAREAVAAERRRRAAAAEGGRRRALLDAARRRGGDAARRRRQMIEQSAQRVAISNALSCWESSVLRVEALAEEAARRAAAAAAADLAARRADQLLADRDRKVKRARQVAQYTAQLRDAIRELKI